MDGQLQGPLKKLAEALHRAIETSPDVEEALSAIRTEGYQAFLMLEVTVALSKPTAGSDDDDETDEDSATEGEATPASAGLEARSEGPDWIIEITDESGQPLLGLGSEPDLAGQGHLAGRIAPDDREFLRSIRIKLDRSGVPRPVAPLGVRSGPLPDGSPPAPCCPAPAAVRAGLTPAVSRFRRGEPVPARITVVVALALTLVPAHVMAAREPARRRAASRAASPHELQRAVFAARDAVLPSLVHIEPIIEVYSRGQRSKAAVTGSGVIVDREGHVLTNDHVVAHAQRVTCILYDKRELTARVVGRDTSTDVAVLQLDLEGGEVPVAELGSSSTLSAGQYVIAMGSPLGLARSISVGVVSTPDRYFPEDFLPSGELTGTYNTWIQTDAAINPGNSGGPLVDLEGRVVGINARAVPIFGENIGFAIPIDVVKDVSSQLIAGGSVRRSWIGAQWQNTKSLAGYFGSGERGGVVVAGLVAGAPAEKAGLQAGDVVIAWNGQPVSARFEEELPAFRKLIADTPIGSPVPVRAIRGGREMEITLATELQPDEESDESALESWGLTARDVTADLARRRRIRDTEGAIVTGVKSAAPAAVAGLGEGDIIREVEGRRIRSLADLVMVHDELSKTELTRLLVRFDRGMTHRLAVLEVAPD